jgi:hypothetical protein
MNTNTIINLDSIIEGLRDELKQIKSLSKKTILPKYTSTQRDALNAVEGLMIYNTTTSAVQIYIDSNWVNAN